MEVRRFYCAAALSTLGSAGLTPVRAGTATEPLEQITVTATRVETPVDAAPATVSVISSDTIAQQLAQNIKDLVRYEPGVSVSRSPARFTAALASTGRDGDSGFNIRGLDGNRVLIQVDGVRVPDAFSFGPQAVGRGDYVDLSVLKSVEILRGPASALYGSDGLAGAVSYITRDPADLLQPGHDVFIGAGAGHASADDSHSENLLLAGRTGRWDALLAYTRRDGHALDNKGDDHAANVSRTAPDPETDASNAALAKLVFHASDTQRLRLSLDHMDSDTDWNVLSAIAMPPLTATSTLALTAFDRMRRDRVMLDHAYEAAGGIIDSAHTAIYVQDSHTRQFSSEDRNTAADRTRDSTFDNRVAGASVELVSRLQHGSVAQRFVYGADYSTTYQHGERNGTVPPVGESFPTHAFPDTDYRLAGVFAQDEITLAGGDLVLYPALRWDHSQIAPRTDPLYVAAVATAQSDSHVTPKLGVVWRLADGVSLFANAAEGFRAPEPSEVNTGFVNFVVNYASLSNPDLKPETSRTLEAGLRLRGERGSVDLAAYTGRYEDFIEQEMVGGSFTPTDPALFQYVNLSQVRISGAEARGRLLLLPGLAATLATGYSRGDYQSAGISQPLQSIDPLKVVAGLDWSSGGRRFGAQLFATYSRGKEAARAGITCTPACFLPGSFTVVDAQASWNINEHVTLRGGVFNIADRKYWWWNDVRGLASTSTVIDAYSQPGRNFSTSIALRY